MFHLKPKPRPPSPTGRVTPGQRGRFLGDHHRAGLAGVRVLVGPLQHLDGLEVLVAAVLVRHPLPGFAGVVEVEHRGDGVDPQTVDVVLVQPVVGVGDQEALHLVAAEIEDVAAPVGVPAQPRVLVLVERGAVEALQRPRVGGEVARDPVDDDADAGLVQLVDQVTELVGGAELAHRGVVAGDVVTPRALERVLRDRQELDVGVALPDAVLDQLGGQLEVGQTLAPRTDVHLVDTHRLLRHLLLLAAVPHPLVVAPGVLALVDDRRGVRGGLGERRHRVGLEPPDAVGAEHLVLVQVAGAHALDEHRPDPGTGDQVHVRMLAVPVVEVTDQPNGLGVGGPHREAGAVQLAALVVGRP